VTTRLAVVHVASERAAQAPPTGDRRSRGGGLEALAADAAKTFGSLLGGAAAVAVAGLIIARALGPQGRGMFELGKVLSFSLALPAGLAVGRAVVVLGAHGRLTRPQLFGSVLLTLVSGAIVGAGIEVTLEVGGQHTFDPLQALLIAGSAPAVVFFSQAQSALRGIDETAWYQRSFFLQGGLFLILVAAAVLLHTGTTGVLVAWFVQWAVAGATLAWLLARACGRPALPRGVVRPLLALTVPQTAVVVLTQLHLRLDIVVLQLDRGPGTVGRYAVATGLAEMLTYFALAVGLSLFPRTARATAGNHRGGAQRSAAALRASLAVTLAGALLLEVVGPKLIVLLFGSSFAHAGTPLRLILPGTVTYALLVVLVNDMSGRARPWAVFAGVGAAVVTNFALNFAIVPTYGAAGAAVVSTITYTLAAALLLGAFCRATEVSVREALVPTRDDFRRIRRAIGWRALPAEG
jgi:O-antigen/teichoic acid export membrane protein